MRSALRPALRLSLRRLSAASCATVLSLALLPVHAQTTPAHSHSHAPAAAAPSGANATAELPMAEAEVRRVDTAAGKITLKHGEIKNLDMPPMTMVFQVRDPALLTQVKAGDKVRFQATQVNGAYTVLSLQPLR